MTTRQSLRELCNIGGYIGSTALHVPPEMDDFDCLVESLRKQHRKYRDAHVKDVIEGIKRGEVDHTQVLSRDGGCNLIMKSFVTDILARMGGSPTADQTLEVKYFAIGTQGTEEDTSDTQLKNEIYRAVPNEAFDDGEFKYFTTTYLQRPQANPPTTTVVTDGGNSTSQVKVADSTGIFVDSKIELQSGVDLTKVAVLSVDGGTDIITYDPETPSVPQNGDTVKVLHSEAGLFMHPATATADSGTPVNRKVFTPTTVKTDQVSILYDATITFAPVP